MSRLNLAKMAAAIGSLLHLAATAADPVTPTPTPASAPAGVPAPPPSAAASGAAAQQLAPVDVIGVRQRLDAARNSLLPETGSTVYRFRREDIDKLPLGDSTPLNQVILQSPGVVQDSFGQLYIRGDHSNIQYRINGVIIPESISGFGQSLETRFADSISVLTGALPAQYGYRTAAIIDIKTKGDALTNGGSVGLLGGSRGYGEANAEYAGSQGAFSYFLTGSWLRSDIGIENPTADRNAIHDTTRQAKGFAYLSYVLDPSSRISVLLGSSTNRFEIPNVAGQTPDFTVAGAAAPVSSTFDARQRERNHFAVVSYQGAAGPSVDYQVSLFNRWTDLKYRPDPVGDLAFYGIAADITRRNIATGVQGDMSFRLNATNTLRAGLFGQRETFKIANTSRVFPADDDGVQTSDTPFSINDDSRIKGRLFGVYVQNEWQPVKALTVNYGLRYDKVNTVVDESQVSPRLGAVLDLTSDLRVHAGYSRYFTPPPTEKIDATSVQKFLGTTNALPSDANTAIKSERSNYYDVGAAWQLTPQITLGIDGYYRQARHLQDEGQFGNALIFSAFNYAQGRISGVDLSASYKEKAFSGYVNVGFTRARGKDVETGQFNFDQDELDYIATHYVHLDHEQRLSGSAGAAYRFGGGFTLSADALYGSGLRKGFANTEHLPSYTQLNLAAIQAFDFGGAIGKVTGRLLVLNVFDRSYELRDGSGIGVGAPQFGPRRTLIAGISKTF